MAPVLSPNSSACPRASSPFVAAAWSRLALGLEGERGGCFGWVQAPSSSLQLALEALRGGIDLIRYPFRL
eukprot:9170758-Pyramimonas_sp.AAC.1